MTSNEVEGSSYSDYGKSQSEKTADFSKDSTKDIPSTISEIQESEKAQDSKTLDVPQISGNRSHTGLNVWQTSFFVLGEIAGSGVLSLPYAVAGTGYIGVLLIIFFAVLSGYSGVVLGRCWVIVEERFTDCQVEVRQPYQMMGQKTFGNWMRWLVTVVLHFVLLGGSVVYVLLISGMLQELFQCIWNGSICYWIMIVTGILVPLSWLGTPKDFWFLAIGASLTVVVAAILITVQCLIDIGVHDEVHYPNVTFKSFSLSFGTILFAFGGACSFPTIQNDMKDRKKFSTSAIFGFIAILSVYLPVACAGYFVFGYFVSSNIALTISDGPLRITAQVLLMLHLLFAFVVVINPSFQDFEQYLKIKPGFSVIRCLFRTVIMLAILFIGESVPQFSKIQNLIGGSGMPVLNFLLPCVIYMKLCGTMEGRWPKRQIPLHEFVLMWEIIIIAVLGGVASTVSAVMDLASPDALSSPCYITLAPPLTGTCD